jgi:hypothetical protein
VSTGGGGQPDRPDAADPASLLSELADVFDKELAESRPSDVPHVRSSSPPPQSQRSAQPAAPSPSSPPPAGGGLLDARTRSVTPLVTRAVSDALQLEERMRNRPNLLPTRSAPSKSIPPRASVPPSAGASSASSLRFPVFGVRSPFASSRRETRLNFEAQRLADALLAVDSEGATTIPAPTAATEAHGALEIDLDSEFDPAESERVRDEAARVVAETARAASALIDVEVASEGGESHSAIEVELTRVDSARLLSLDDPATDDPAGEAEDDPIEVELTDLEPTEEELEVRGLRERVEQRDWLGALRRAEAILERDAAHGLAFEVQRIASEQVERLLTNRLGGPSRVLRAVMSVHEIRHLQLDPRAGFLIMLLDGTATLEEILDMSGMPSLEALRLLVELQQQGVLGDDAVG